MRFWLKDSERKPDPPPLRTDDRTVVLVGIALWLAALAVMLVMLGTLVASGLDWLLWTVVVGIGLGLVLLVVTHRRRG